MKCMKTFLNEDFLLQSDTAKELYHQHAENMPIYDYHCHLSPKDILNQSPIFGLSMEKQATTISGGRSAETESMRNSSPEMRLKEKNSESGQRPYLIPSEIPCITGLI